jgi:hypothetical protein
VRTSPVLHSSAAPPVDETLTRSATMAVVPKPGAPGVMAVAHRRTGAFVVTTVAADAVASIIIIIIIIISSSSSMRSITTPLSCPA